MIMKIQFVNVLKIVKENQVKNILEWMDFVEIVVKMKEMKNQFMMKI